MIDKLGKKIMFFDGAMGTMLQKAGLETGKIPEEWNIDKPDVMVSIHEQYLNAGADFITTNTFGCNRIKMRDSKYSVEEMIKAAVKNAKIAKDNTNKKDSYIALDIGPIGQLLKPLGTLSFDEAYDIIAEQVNAVKDDIDVVLMETMSDLYELKAGILAVKENSDLPIFVTMTFEKSGRSLTGVDPVTFVNVVEGLGVDALGVNCSLGPIELTPIIETILENAHIPVIAQPNAGLPVLKDGKTCYNVTPTDFADALSKVALKGLSVCGGCCGTTPEYIEAIKNRLPALVKPYKNKYVTKVSSQNKTVVFDGHVVVCGERLNPTGKKKMQAALKEGRFEELVKEAIRQEEAGAEVLDVNVGLPGVDEVETMKIVIPMLQEVVNLPLQIDSSSPEAIEAACRIYNGKPLINSVNGNDSVMESIFPIVKKYGGVVLGLTLEDKIPTKATQRVDIAKKIIDKASKYGIPLQDIIIDCLTLTASAQQKEVKETLEAVRIVSEMGQHAALGVSNVSFGLPNRALLNRTFLVLAMQMGLDLPIINPLDTELMSVIDAFNVLYNIDKDSEKYIQKHANDIITKKFEVSNNSANDSLKVEKMDLGYMIRRGMKEEVKSKTKEELEHTSAVELINNVIVPALNTVGLEYEQGKIFLPQLIQAAETTKEAFEIVKTCFGEADEKKGPVIVCTVEGDIHDIGKNIVKVVLESYGYDIIDIGKDVKPMAVLEACKNYQPKAIGLSALMTTTVANMKKTIDLLKISSINVPVWVGGAVLSEEIAKEIGADYYCEDAMASVHLLDNLL